MYRILSDSGLLDVTDKPNYIRYKPETDSYVTADEETAEGVAVNSIPYNLPGHTMKPELQTAYLFTIEDVGQYFYNGLKETAQLTNVTAERNDDRATQNYAAGSYLIRGATLYKVTRAIAKGENIVENVNVKATDVMTELNEMRGAN